MAIELYYEPFHIARKAAINYFIDEGRNIEEVEGDEINQLAHELLETMLIHQIMEEYEVDSFGASTLWVLKMVLFS